MGADLYRKPGFDDFMKPLRDEESGRLKEGIAYDDAYGSKNPFYFRDCYNSRGLFANLTPRLSWWQDVGAIQDEWRAANPITDEDAWDGAYPPEVTAKVLALVESRPRPEAHPADGFPDEDYGEWYDELVRFLRAAVENGDRVIYST